MPGEIVVGIPGLWKDRSDIIASIANANATLPTPTYLAAGSVLLHLPSKQGLGFEVYERDPSMREAFQAAGQRRLSGELLDAIDRHTYTVYLVSKEEGREAARRLLSAAAFLLRVGGLAVKVESSGVASAPDRWTYFAGSRSTLSLYEAFSVLIGGQDFFYSCGMRTFGLPDASVPSTLPPQEASEVISCFNHWQLLESPAPKDGDLFAMPAPGPAFRLSHREYGYDPEELLNNSHGRWHLELTDLREPMPPELQARGEPLFMAMKSDDPRVVDSVRRARSTLGYFLRHASCPHEYGIFLFKIHLTQERAYLWLRFEEVKGDRLLGSVFEVPPEFKTLRRGQKVEAEAGEVFDWAIKKSGTLIGGYSARLSRENLDPRLRKAWDRYTGYISFAPLEEIDP